MTWQNFVDGLPLTAAMLSSMQAQTTLTFSSRSSRTSALTGVSVPTGGLSYLQDEQLYERWDGAAWTPCGIKDYKALLSAQSLITSSAISGNATLLASVGPVVSNSVYRLEADLYILNDAVSSGDSVTLFWTGPTTASFVWGNGVTYLGTYGNSGSGLTAGYALTVPTASVGSNHTRIAGTLKTETVTGTVNLQCFGYQAQANHYLQAGSLFVLEKI